MTKLFIYIIKYKNLIITVFQELERPPFWKNQFQELERPQKKIAYFIIFYTCIKNFKIL